jgi:catechol 2,3-dioxygenase-like lactoylglutathione lyase family enzyme
MHPIEVRQVKEVILVTDDAHASRGLYREVLGLAMPAGPDRLNLARVGVYFLDPDANLIELWAPRAAPTST